MAGLALDLVMIVMRRCPERVSSFTLFKDIS